MAVHVGGVPAADRVVGVQAPDRLVAAVVVDDNGPAVK